MNAELQWGSWLSGTSHEGAVVGRAPVPAALPVACSCLSARAQGRNLGRRAYYLLSSACDCVQSEEHGIWAVLEGQPKCK